jgi:hypothetical protein
MSKYKTKSRVSLSHERGKRRVDDFWRLKMVSGKRDYQERVLLEAVTKSKMELESAVIEERLESAKSRVESLEGRKEEISRVLGRGDHTIAELEAFLIKKRRHTRSAASKSGLSFCSKTSSKSIKANYIPKPNRKKS